MHCELAVGKVVLHVDLVGSLTILLVFEHHPGCGAVVVLLHRFLYVLLGHIRMLRACAAIDGPYGSIERVRVFHRVDWALHALYSPSLLARRMCITLKGALIRIWVQRL